MAIKVRSAAVFSALAATGLIHTPASANVADFYKGKTVKIIVGHQTGTGFDLYARTLARYLGPHIPGTPGIVVQNMNGASGLKSLNYIASIAPNDGTAFATMVFSAPFEPLMGAGKGKFDATKLVWIGNMDRSVSVCGVSKKAGIARFNDLFKKQIIVGGTGRAGPLNQVPNALRNLLGAKLKVVTGYRGSRSVKLAIERGEVEGACGISWSTVKTRYRSLREAGNYRIILQVGPRPHAELKGVPHVYSYAKSDKDRKVFDLIFGVQGLGRSFVGPEGIPADRVTALRKAFMDTMSDKALLAEAKKTKLDLNPEPGDEVQAFVQKIYAAPADVVTAARTAIKAQK